MMGLSANSLDTKLLAEVRQKVQKLTKPDRKNAFARSLQLLTKESNYA